MVNKKKIFFTGERVLLLSCIVMSLLALLFIFADCTYLVGSSNLTGFSSEKVYLSGIEATFGKTGVVDFSFANLFCYILLVLGIILLLIKFCGKLQGRSFDYILFVLLLVCSVMFFSSGALMVLAKDNNTALAASWGIKIMKNITYGAIISGMVCLISSFLMLYLASIKRTKKRKI